MSDAQERTRPTSRRIPAPAQNLESKPFWDAAKEPVKAPVTKPVEEDQG